MTLTDAASLIGELRQGGVELEVVGEKIRVRPTSAVSPELQARLAACKPMLLAILHEEAVRQGAGDGKGPTPDRCAACGQRDFQHPRAGGAWRCARCRPYDLPSSGVEWWPRIEMAVPLEQVLAHGGPEPSAARAPMKTRPCWSCRGRVFWRLKTAGNWICSRCHPPQPPQDEIVTATIDAAEVER